jgi:signal transduction histidine kinase/putative methionine-R-sulfoxide reductase with GAF domain
VWVSIENSGLYRLDPSPGDRSKLMIIKFPQDASDPELPDLGTVMSFYEDAQGRLWMGSVEGGLVLFNRDTQTFTHYVPDTGPGRYISCIQGDDQGFLWMATELGLARFDPRTETFSYFDARDGLVIGEGSACFRNQQGEMFFGSSKGVNTFFPDQIQSNPNPPPVVITALNLKNQPLRDNLLPDAQIRLSYRENYLSFDFAALDFNAPAKNQYAYKMEGLDTDWVQAGTRRHADYPDLKPGTYTFRVKAANNSGVWNEQGAAVHITITPPFWQTWWFTALVGLALAGVVAGGVRLRLKSVETRGRELEDQVAGRTRELVALNEIATVLNRPQELHSVLSDVLEKTLEVIKVEAGGIYFLDEKAQTLNIAVHRGLSPQLSREIDTLQVGEGFSGSVIQSGRSLVVRDVSTDPRLTRIAVRSEGFHSLAVVPLTSRDQARGTLFAMTHGQREFSDQEIQLLESIGHQVGAAIENARLYEDTRSQVAQLTALQETASAVSGTLELDDLLHLIIQQATVLMRADGGFLNLADWDNRVDECVAVTGIAPPVVGERVPLEGSLSGWVSLHNQAMITNQISGDDRVAQSVRTWVTKEHIQSAACAPLVVRDQVKGSLLVIGQEKGRGTFDHADLDLLISFANQAAIAVENAFLYEQTRRLAHIEERRRRELEALLTADDRMQRCLHEDQVLQALVDVTVDILHADKSAVIWWDEKREKLIMRLARGFRPSSIGEFQFTRDKGIIGSVVTHREPVLLQDAANDPRRFEEDPHIVEVALAEGMGSFIHYPIIIGQEVLGVFSVIYEKTYAAGEGELRLFQALLQRAALYIENARLYKQSQEVAVLEERARLARELHDAVTQTLFSASLLAEALPATWEKNPAEGRELLQELRGLSRGALAEMRTLLLELRPAALVETRLEDLLRQLGEAASGRTGIPVTVKVEGQAKLPRDVHIAFYRITQEALNNVVKHARARQVTVHLRYQCEEPTFPGARVILTVCDDGRGFDPARIPPNHLGLGIMQERARSIGAMMTIESQPGRGTQLTVRWEQAEPEEEK